MTAILDLFKDAIGYLWTAPSWLLLLIVLNLTGVYLQWVKWFPNQCIVLVLSALSVFLLELLIDPMTVAGRSPRIVIALVGIIIGAISYGLHFAFIHAWNKWVASNFKDDEEPKTP